MILKDFAVTFTVNSIIDEDGMKFKQVVRKFIHAFGSLGVLKSFIILELA